MALYRKCSQTRLDGQPGRRCSGDGAAREDFTDAIADGMAVQWSRYLQSAKSDLTATLEARNELRLGFFGANGSSRSATSSKTFIVRWLRRGSCCSSPRQYGEPSASRAESRDREITFGRRWAQAGASHAAASDRERGSGVVGDALAGWWLLGSAFDQLMTTGSDGHAV